MNLSDLTKKRRDHIRSCHDNNDNSHEIIAGLYSDPSHFIYELLQNADDAGASEVTFCLTSKSLEITHNGEKLFDFNDVDSITTVGSSTKKDDVNLIGKFGSGFKSVFAITKTPIIHSGNFHFKITDFIVPEEIESPNIELNKETKIILPFNHSDISSEKAYEQISIRLQELESESLLFLRNIKEIQWSTENKEGHYLAEVKDNKATLMSEIDKQDNLKEYYLFTENVEISGTKLDIIVAYPYKDKRIVRMQNSKLFVYFPVNERTGLEFLVHAPYKTTPSRESIPFNDEQNQNITAQLASLIAESIIEIKNNGLLSVDFLSMLPIDSKNEHPIYRATFDQIKEIFKTQPLLPTSSGHYEISGKVILAREKELTNLLWIEDCLKLFERESWLTTDITYDKTRALRDYLMKELSVPEIDMEKFCAKISKQFIENKSDEWMIQFYSSIESKSALYREGGILRKRPIIRLEDDTHICPENEFGKVQIYLPPKEGQSKFKTIKRSLVKNREFLKNLGLKEIDNIAEIKELIIPKYQGNYIKIKLDEYKGDLTRVFSIWSKSSEYKKKEIIDLLKQCRFIRCMNQGKSISYQTGDNVYLDTDELSEWFRGNMTEDIYFLAIFLATEFKNEEGKTFLENLGVRNTLKLSNTSMFRQDSFKDNKIGVSVLYPNFNVHVNEVDNEEFSQKYGFDPDFNIHGLKFALKHITFDRSKFLWKLLLENTSKLRGYIAETSNKRQKPYKITKGEKLSEAMKLLDNHRWLYDNKEKIIDQPIGQIMLKDLSDEYQKEDDNIEKLIKALGLKLDEIVEFEKKTGMKAISVEDYALL
ncbi:hypothetical protein KY334_07765, partial [Candidatus Woesearchaeota archaeon]|nr:hypothetical protein [Candidatus Woesearchaeota archaeon]